jgi:hypothetical protein
VAASDAAGWAQGGGQVEGGRAARAWEGEWDDEWVDVTQLTKDLRKRAREMEGDPRGSVEWRRGRSGPRGGRLRGRAMTCDSGARFAVAIHT